MDSSKKELYNIVDGETFYTVPVTLDGETIPMVASEYLIKDITGTAVLTGYLRSDNIKSTLNTEDGKVRKERLYTYFMCTEMEEVSDEAAIVHKVCVSGRITKRTKLSTLKSGKQILPIVVRCKTDDGHTSIIHVVLSNKNARYVNSLEDISNVSINTTGFINVRYGTIEVHAEEAEIYRKEGTNNG